MNGIIYKTFLLLLVLITAAASEELIPKCPKNQIYKETGFDCWTCSNYMIVRCMLITKPQCFCIDDYVHHDVTGECIPKSQCPPPVCGENEIYAIGSNCQTCSNYAVVLCAPATEKQCICKSGYYRHDVTGVCTRVEDCPVCPGNQTYSTYSDRDCQTCSNWQLVDCMPKDTPACYCDNGFVHPDNDPGECIATEDCPEPKCGQHEEYKIGTNCATCSNYARVLCLPTLEKLCVCKSGYVRHDVTRVCTLIEHCPATCPHNEHYGENEFDCLTCQDIANGIMKRCAANPEAKCYCDIGFNRDIETGICRPYEECERACGLNEEFLHEGVDGVTCENRFYVKYAPQKISKCYCLPEHVRNAQNVCTHVNDCP